MRVSVKANSPLAKALRARRAAVKADVAEGTGQRFVVAVLNDDAKRLERAMCPTLAILVERLIAVLREEGVEDVLNGRA